MNWLHRAGRGAQVHRASDAREDVKLLVDLQELVRRARAPALLLGLAVVDVALVLRVLPHISLNSGQLRAGRLREMLVHGATCPAKMGSFTLAPLSKLAVGVSAPVARSATCAEAEITQAAP